MHALETNDRHINNMAVIHSPFGNKSCFVNDKSMNKKVSLDLYIIFFFNTTVSTFEIEAGMRTRNLNPFP